MSLGQTAWKIHFFVFVISTLVHNIKVFKHANHPQTDWRDSKTPDKPRQNNKKKEIEFNEFLKWKKILQN